MARNGAGIIRPRSLYGRLAIWSTRYTIILRSRLGSDPLKERKKPGPHPEKPLEHDLKVRVSQESLDKIQFCMDQLNLTRSEVLQRGVDSLYDRLQKSGEPAMNEARALTPSNRASTDPASA